MLFLKTAIVSRSFSVPYGIYELTGGFLALTSVVATTTSNLVAKHKVVCILGVLWTYTRFLAPSQQQITSWCQRKNDKRPHQQHSQWNMISTAWKFGGNLVTLKFTERYIDDPKDAMYTLTILQSMTSSNDKNIIQVIADMGGVETTVKALNRYSEESDEVACSGCGLLMNVCGSTDKNDKRVLECGGVRALVLAMQHWPDNERLQSAACTAIDRLATNTEATRKKIVDVGGLVALATARTKHQNDIRVRVPSDHALLILVQGTQEL